MFLTSSLLFFSLTAVCNAQINFSYLHLLISNKVKENKHYEAEETKSQAKTQDRVKNKIQHIWQTICINFIQTENIAQ